MTTTPNMANNNNYVWRIIIDKNYLKSMNNEDAYNFNPCKILVDNGYTVINDNKSKDNILIRGDEDYARTILDTYDWIYVIIEATLPQDIPIINNKRCATFITYNLNHVLL